MNELEKELSKFDDDYNSAEEPERGNFDPIPNGKYQVNVEKISFEESKAGNTYLGWEFKIISGNFENRKLWKHNMLQTPENMKYLKGDLSTCGIKLEKLSELPSRLHEILDLKLEVTVRNKPGDNGKTNTNVFLNSKLIDAANIPNDGELIPF